MLTAGKEALENVSFRAPGRSAFSNTERAAPLEIEVDGKHLGGAGGGHGVAKALGFYRK